MQSTATRASARRASCSDRLLDAARCAVGGLFHARRLVGGEERRDTVLTAGKLDLDGLFALLQRALRLRAALLELDAAHPDAIAAQIERVDLADDERVGRVGQTLLATDPALEVRGRGADRAFLTALGDAAEL